MLALLVCPNVCHTDLHARLAIAELSKLYFSRTHAQAITYSIYECWMRATSKYLCLPHDCGKSAAGTTFASDRLRARVVRVYGAWSNWVASFGCPAKLSEAMEAVGLRSMCCQFRGTKCFAQKFYGDHDHLQGTTGFGLIGLSLG